MGRRREERPVLVQCPVGESTSGAGLLESYSHHFQELGSTCGILDMKLSRCHFSELNLPGRVPYSRHGGRAVPSVLQKSTDTKDMISRPLASLSPPLQDLDPQP